LLESSQQPPGRNSGNLAITEPSDWAFVDLVNRVQKARSGLVHLEICRKLLLTV